MPKEIKFDRASLYEEVWSKPMRTLAQQYGLSDNGLRKVCAALAVPLPQQGHWAKVAAGHKVSKTPLPPHDGRTVFISRPPAPVPFEAERAAETKAAKQKSTARQAQSIALQFDPEAQLHPVLAPYERALRESAKEYDKALKAHNNPPRNPHWSNPSTQLASKYDYWEEHGFELCHMNRALPLRVTPSTWQRALTIVNAIVKYAQVAKMSIESVPNPPRVVIKSGDVAVHIRIAELFEEVIVKPRDNHSRTKHLRGTGKLRLFISHESWNSAKQIEETAEERLESKSEAILSLIDRQFASARIADLERKDRERRWKEERERAEIEHQRRERERQRLQEEQARRDSLEKEAGDWDRAERLRRYATALEGLITRYSGVAASQGADFVDELRERPRTTSIPLLSGCKRLLTSLHPPRPKKRPKLIAQGKRRFRRAARRAPDNSIWVGMSFSALVWYALVNVTVVSSGLPHAKPL